MAEFDASKLRMPNLRILGQDTRPLFADAKGKKDNGQLPPALAAHAGFNKAFQKGKLTELQYLPHQVLSFKGANVVYAVVCLLYLFLADLPVWR